MTVGTARPQSITREIGEDGHVTYQAVYAVSVTDPFEFPDNVSVATGIPFYGDFLTWGSNSNPDAICSKKVVNPVLIDATNLERTVTCTFTTKSGNRPRNLNNVVTNPVNEAWKASGSFATGTRITSIDKNGAPIYTTAKERKSFETPDGYDTLHLKGPSLTISMLQRAQAVLRCNSATIWTGLTARMVFLAQWQWEQLFHGGDDYFYHHLEFWIKYAGWNEVWLNAGTQYISGGGQIIPILADNDSLGKNERFLDGAGAVIPPASVPGSIVTNTTQIIPEFDFTALTASIGMPNPLPGNFV